MIKEHDRIMIKDAIHREGYEIPADTRGTIVHIYPGEPTPAYEVEFPEGLVITVYSHEIV